MVLPGDLIEDYDNTFEEGFKEIDKIFNQKGNIERLLSEVGDKCKELLTYTISYDLMIEDIMIRMDFPSVGAVKMQLKRCKEKLYKIVEENSELIKSIKNQ